MHRDCQYFKQSQKELVSFLDILTYGALFIPKSCADLTRGELTRALLLLCGYKSAFQQLN